MKTKFLVWVALAILVEVGVGTAGAATNDVSTLLQKGLFEEEANQNLDGAIQAYQAVIAQSEKTRQFAATAIFRLGECYRKEGKTNEAVAQYQRVLREFTDQTELAKLSRQNLAGMEIAPPAENGTPAVSQATLQKEKQLLQEEIKLVEDELESQQKRVKLGLESTSDLLPTQEKLIELKRQLAAMESGQAGQAASAVEDSDARLWAKVKDLSPGDLEEVLPTLAPDPVLTTLLQRRNEAEAKLAQLLASEGEHNPDVLTEKAGMNAINKQISEKISGIMQALKLRAEISGTAVSATGSTAAAPSGSEIANFEEQEIQRIQKMVQDSPDLINGPNGPLGLAANAGQLRVAAYLLDHGANVNGAPGDPPLVQAAAGAQKTMVELLLSRGADVNARDGSGGTALLKAVNGGYSTVVEVLLEHKAEVNVHYTKMNAGDTPLHVAAKNAYTNLVSLLLAHGADADAVNDRGETPLWTAAYAGNTDVIKLLLAHKAAVDGRDGLGGTPLLAATVSGHLESCRLLLESGANVNAVMNGEGPTGLMPLHLAVSKNENDLVKLFLDYQAEPDARISYFRTPQGAHDVTPLLMAVMNLQKETVELLLAHKADVNAMDAAGDTPLTMLAAARIILNGSGGGGGGGGFGGGGLGGGFGGRGGRSGVSSEDTLSDRLEIAALLLNHGADVNARNKANESALSLAVASQFPEMVKAILAHKPKVDMLDNDEWTPLQRAVASGQADMASLLLDTGANVDVKYPRTGGIGLLTRAVMDANKPLVEVLLAHKADPNAQDDAGRTPLSEAKRLQSNPPSPIYPGVMGEIVEVLLRAGANDNLQRLSTISVSRNSANFNFKDTVFLKGNNSFNHYTLLQLLTAFYAPPNPVQLPNGRQLPGLELAFPDFDRIKISRLQKDGRTNIIAVDFDTPLNTGDCSADVPLEWGDVVEIPESDHKVDEKWTGLTDKVGQTLWKCLGGKVAIVVKGQTNTVLLALRHFRPSRSGFPETFDGTSYNINYPSGSHFQHGTIVTALPPVPDGPWSFLLYDVVQGANVILTSSDLSRVKVTRADAATGKHTEMIFDLRTDNPSNCLWLRDGDVIEIPEKP